MLFISHIFTTTLNKYNSAVSHHRTVPKVANKRCCSCTCAHVHVFAPVHEHCAGCMRKRKDKCCLVGEEQNKQKNMGWYPSCYLGRHMGRHILKALYLANIFWEPEGSLAGPLQVLEVQGP